MSEEIIKDFWGKNEDTNNRRVDSSKPGDEIVIISKDENNKLNKRTFINVVDGNFVEVRVVNGPDFKGGQKQIEPININKTILFNEMKSLVNSSKENMVYWHRKVFTEDEAYDIGQGKIIKNYDAIKKEYYPQKMLADMKLTTAAFLLTATPRSEINYYKYKDGNQSGIDSYICTQSFKFRKLRKRKLSEENREVTIVGNQLYEVWDIMATLPRKETELSPMKDINIRIKWNKYNIQEMNDLLHGKSLNDILIEERRRKYLTTDHRYVKNDENSNEYTEYWIDKTSKEIVLQKNRELTDEMVEKYAKNQLIISKEQLDSIVKKPEQEKAKPIGIKRNLEKGMER